MKTGSGNSVSLFQICMDGLLYNLLIDLNNEDQKITSSLLYLAYESQIAQPLSN